MLQIWPRTEVRLSWSAGPAEFSEAGEPDGFRCIHFPSECCTFAAGYCTCVDQPHFDLQLQQGSANAMAVSPAARASHPITFNVRTPVQCPVLPYMPDNTPTLTDSLDLSMTWTSAATRRADWVTGNRAQSTHVQYISCTTAVATSFHMIAGAAGRRSLPHCGASFSGGPSL